MVPPVGPIRKVQITRRRVVTVRSSPISHLCRLTRYLYCRAHHLELLLAYSRVYPCLPHLLPGDSLFCLVARQIFLVLGDCLVLSLVGSFLTPLLPVVGSGEGRELASNEH